MSAKTPKSDDSFPLFEKFSTLSKKKAKEKDEAAALEQEGMSAISAEGQPPEQLEPEDFKLEEGGEVRMVMEKDIKEPPLAGLIDVLRDWLNEVLLQDRMVVRRLEEDLYDGQVLQILLSRLFNTRVNEPDVIHSEHGQRQRLETVLAALNEKVKARVEWSTEEIYARQLVPILRLLVAIVAAARAPVKLPARVVVPVLVVQKRDGNLETTRRKEEILASTEAFQEAERDMLDDIFQNSPDRVEMLCRHLLMFMNSQLGCLNMSVQSLEQDATDGVYLIILLGLLEGYFVPLHHYYNVPQTKDQKVHNVTMLYELMEDAGILRPTARPEEVVNGDLKAVLRVGLPIFSKYKNRAASRA